MAGKASAVDLGSHTIKVLALKLGKNGVAVQRFGASNASDGAQGLSDLGIPIKNVVVGLAGRDMTLRYTQVPPSPDWQLRNLMDLEIQDLSSQSGGQLSADYNLLPIVDEEAGMDTILMGLARDEALGGAVSVIADAAGSVNGHVPNCIALYNAYLRCAPIDDEDEVVCLANIGRETSDIALVRGQDLLFARNLSSGGKVLDDAIGAAFNVSERKAESLKHDLLDLDPASRGRYASGHAEKVTLAAGGAASMIVSAIQSSLAFCQSQTKIQDLRLDRVLLSGGSASIRGLRGMLREALRCPVEIFDPWVSVDLSSLPADDMQQLDLLRCEAVVALGLALSRADPNLYALEILPENIKRRQRFLQRTVYNIGAGLVGVALLVLAAMQSQAELKQGESASRVLRRESNSVISIHEQAENLVEANAIERAIATQLSAKSIPLDGLLRTLRAIQDTLPDELWVTAVEVGKKSQGGRNSGSNTRPVIIVKGSGKPVGGIDVGAAYRRFVAEFKAHDMIRPPSRQSSEGDDEPPPQSLQRVKTAVQTKGQLTEFTFEIDFMPEVEEG